MVPSLFNCCGCGCSMVVVIQWLCAYGCGCSMVCSMVVIVQWFVWLVRCGCGCSMVVWLLVVSGFIRCSMVVVVCLVGLFVCLFV